MSDELSETEEIAEAIEEAREEGRKQGAVEELKNLEKWFLEQQKSITTRPLISIKLCLAKVKTELEGKGE
jgi:hypothetical protein